MDWAEWRGNRNNRLTREILRIQIKPQCVLKMDTILVWPTPSAPLMEAASLTLVKALEAVISVVAVTGSNPQGEYRLEGEAMDHLRLVRLQVERAEKVIAAWQENRHKNTRR
jgi:hypothetical protein